MVGIIIITVLLALLLAISVYAIVNTLHIVNRIDSLYDKFEKSSLNSSHEFIKNIQQERKEVMADLFGPANNPRRISIRIWIIRIGAIIFGGASAFGLFWIWFGRSFYERY